MTSDEISAAAPPHASLVRWLNELSTGGIFTTDGALKISSWNRWLVRSTGLAEKDVIGRPLFDVFPDLVTRGIDPYYSAALRGEAILLAYRFHQHLLRIDTPYGPMPQSTRIAPLLVGEDIVGTITAIEDVSERVTSEAELRRQIGALEEARRTTESALRVKDEFLATLSHELRTPLNAVMGWTRILQGRGVDPATSERALQVIDRNVVAQARLIDDLLDMSRIEAGKLRLEMGPVDFVSCALQAIDVVTPAANGKGISIERNLGESAVLIQADADRIQQVVWNLLANAVKFTPRGGRITLRLEEESGSAKLTVQDSGKGIAPEFLPHVFERFSQANSTASRAEGGLGLGLALARQLIELHGGEIAVHSDGLTRGATFTVILPTLREAIAVLPPAAERPTVKLAGRSVLIVEDASDWADLLARTIQEEGGQATVATSAEEAITHALHQRFDAIVADIGLAGEDGYTMLRRLRAALDGAARIPAVAVTAYAGKQYRDRAREAGYDAYRAKPISPLEVVNAILEILG